MTGRTVVITGASSGIGLAAARAFAARGDRLVLGSRGEQALTAAAEQCRRDGAPNVQVRVLDVGDATSVTAFFDGLGQVDVVVHSAMAMAYGSIEQLPPEVFTSVVRTGIEGSFSVARAALGLFREQGRGVLVMVNSVVGSIAAPDMGAYAVAKWGQAALIRTLQLETRAVPGVHVCSVSPGGVDTPIYYQAANYTGRTPRPPIPIDPPERVARAIVGLADRPKRDASVGVFNPLMVFGFRVFPWLYDLLVGPLLRLVSLTGEVSVPSEGNVFSPVDSAEAVHGRWPRRWDNRPR